MIFWRNTVLRQSAKSRKLCNIKIVVLVDSKSRDVFLFAVNLKLTVNSYCKYPYSLTLGFLNPKTPK